MILFIGQVQRDALERGAFQEMDYRAVFGSTSPNGSAEIETRRAFPKSCHRAFHVAMQGRPGPVVIALPEDMLGTSRTSPTRRALSPPDLAWPDQDGGVAEAAVGGETADRHPRRTRLDEKAARRCTVSPNVSTCPSRLLPPRRAVRHRSSQLRRRCRHRHQSEAVQTGSNEADLVLLFGGRMSEMPSQGYTLLDIPYAAPDAGPCPCGCRRARPRLSPRAWHSRDAVELRAALEGSAAARPDRLGGRTRRAHAADFATGRRRPPVPGPVQLGRSCLAARQRRAGRRHHGQWRRQLRHLARHVSCASAGSTRRLAPTPARWAMACRPPSPRSACSRTGS